MKSLYACTPDFTKIRGKLKLECFIQYKQVYESLRDKHKLASKVICSLNCSINFGAL